MQLAAPLSLTTILGTALLAAASAGAQDALPTPPNAHARVIIRCDDIGFCHAANMAAEKLLKERACSSLSVIVNTPWLDEAVAILAEHPEVSVGVHLTLNAEWREYRWGPVLPYTEVPSLVDADGKFFPSRKALFENNPKTAEVEKELRAQIRLALRKGLRISYVDYHMGAAMSTPELQNMVESLAKEFNLGISQYFGETYVPTVFSTPPEKKLAEAIRIIDGMTEPKLYLFVCHVGANTPELAAMTDLNPTGPKPMAVHRQAELDVLCSKEFKAALGSHALQLTNYGELRTAGLEHMKRPWTADPYKAHREAITQPSPPAGSHP
jgi:chitin disaccharide deacetylase